MNNTRGSEWGKWDLQVQTILDDGYVSLGSYYNELKSSDKDRWNKFTSSLGGEESALKFDSKAYFGDERIPIEERCQNYAETFFKFLAIYNPDLRGIVLTDHNYYHPQLIDSLHRVAKKRELKVIPGVEINVGGVHLLVAFDEAPFKKTSYSDGIKAFLGKIDVDSPRKENGSLTVTQKDITEVIKIVRGCGGLVIFPHCNTDNGLFQERQRTDRENLFDIFNYQSCNIIQTHTKESADKLSEYITNNTNLHSQFCITTASDSRCLRDIGQEDEKGNFFWVKAESGFNGLEQLLHEPKDRAYIGVKPPKLAAKEKTPGKFIDKISINPKSEIQDPWFDQEIELNAGLVAIIGKKGSGKSALTDIIALLGKSSASPDNYSFLTEKRFRKRKLASIYDASITWSDGDNYPVDLMLNVDPTTEPERVKYLPQKYVESICDDFGVSTKFQDEINRVIFSYVPEEKRHGWSNLDELIDYKSKSIDTAVMQLTVRLNDKNTDIEKIELKTKPAYKQLMREKLTQRENDLKNLKKPSEVKKPKQSSAVQTQIDAVNSDIEKISETFNEQAAKLAKANSKVSDLRVISSQIDNFKQNLDALEDDISINLSNLGLKFNDLVELKVDNKKLQAQATTLYNTVTKLEIDLGKKPKPQGAKQTTFEKLEALKLRRTELKSQLTKADTKYQKYLEDLKEFTQNQKSIKGSEDDGTLDSIESIKSELNYIASSANSELKTLYSDRNTILKNIFDKKNEKISFYEEIYSPLTELLEQEKEAQEEAGSVLSFKVEPVFERSKFVDQFESMIDQSAKGNYRGKEEGIKALVELMDSHNFGSAEGIIAFDDSLIKSLLNVGSGKDLQQLDLDAQLLNTSRTQFYNFLFGLDFIEVKYNLRFNGKELNEDQFSPGEKGALLLIFYLLIEKGKIPLLIDQPEENLDNESVFDLLVPYIKQAKNERQVILVTHNPNLAVVCDAEQIIHAKMDKKRNTVRYSSGALENMDINTTTSNVLEGTLQAFDVRNSKYKR